MADNPQQWTRKRRVSRKARRQLARLRRIRAAATAAAEGGGQRAA